MSLLLHGLRAVYQSLFNFLREKFEHVESSFKSQDDRFAIIGPKDVFDGFSKGNLAYDFEFVPVIKSDVVFTSDSE